MHTLVMLRDAVKGFIKGEPLYFLQLILQDYSVMKTQKIMLGNTSNFSTYQSN